MKPVWSAKEIRADMEELHSEHFELTTDEYGEPKKLSMMQEREATHTHGVLEGMADALRILEES